MRQTDVTWYGCILLQDVLTMFGVFDGHAGADVAVTVSHELPHRIKVSTVYNVLRYITFSHWSHMQSLTRQIFC